MKDYKGLSKSWLGSLTLSLTKKNGYSVMKVSLLPSMAVKFTRLFSYLAIRSI